MDNLNLSNLIQESINDHEKTFAYVSSLEFKEKLKKNWSSRKSKSFCCAEIQKKDNKKKILGSFFT